MREKKERIHLRTLLSIRLGLFVGKKVEQNNTFTFLLFFTFQKE